MVKHLILPGLLAAAGAGVAVYAHHNLTYDESFIKALPRKGFTEKRAALPDGTVLNYGEGPANGPALLLLHGQGVTWRDYAKTLPLLSKRFHVFAVDCHGHGKSSFVPEKYTAVAMGTDFVWFLEHIVGEPAYVSGHSSGGLLTAWLAANAPQWVRSIAIEDAPLFSTEELEKEKSFAYQASFSVLHDYLNQTEEPDYLNYYLARSPMKDMFGKGWPKMMKTLNAYRVKHPDKTPRVWWLPPSINAIWTSISDPYDKRFGETFYDQSWFTGFNQAETLARVACPTVFLKAATRWKDGVLLAALSEEDCQRVCGLIPDCHRVDFPKAGHDIHNEEPAAFAEAVISLLNE